jgi:hypothetical protein
MYDRIKTIDHQLDRRRRLGTLAACIVDTGGKARKACRRLRRQAVHAPHATPVTADLQLQGHRSASVQQAARKNENVLQRHDAETEQHQDQ